ncbi:MAG: nitrous oxide reductase family maturation protein NosD [Candidatus Hodarchaeota archaeon]
MKCVVLALLIFAFFQVSIQSHSFEMPKFSSDYVLHNPIAVSNDTELASVAVFGSGIETDPYILEGWNITTAHVHGISISNTTAHFIIRNCWIDTGDTIEKVGIYIQNAMEGTVTISNNTCRNNWSGILLINAMNSRVLNNTCRNNWSGIAFINSAGSIVANNIFVENGFFIQESSPASYLSYSVVNNWVNGQPLGWLTNKANITILAPYGELFLINCTNIIVKNQNCSYCNDGITILFSSHIQVLNNTVSNHAWAGIFVWRSESILVANNSCLQNTFQGMYVLDSKNVTVQNNTCNRATGGWWGGGYGIALSHSNSCRILWNEFRENKNYGIFLDEGADNNVIHHNSFLLNNNGAVQASDAGANNVWYDPTTNEGNYWSDLSGTAVYLIDGSAYAFDPFPLTSSPFAPNLPDTSQPAQDLMDLLPILFLIPICGLGLTFGIVSSEFLALYGAIKKHYRYLKQWKQELESKRLELIEQSNDVELELIASEIEAIYLRNEKEYHNFLYRLKSTWLPSVLRPSTRSLEALHASATQAFRNFQDTRDQCKQIVSTGLM